MAVLLVLAGLLAIVLLAGRLGSDTRPADPGCLDPQWPFARHDG
jgi:hypothetical protein